ANAPMGTIPNVSESSSLFARRNQRNRPKRRSALQSWRGSRIRGVGSSFAARMTMCGIAGQFNFVRYEAVDPDRIVRMTRALTHRGPDDEGYFIDGPLGLGFRRLSIIDLSGGHQPMCDSEERVWVIFNGEIYNFKELRAELEARGHRFRTKSDTEVIVLG